MAKAAIEDEDFELILSLDDTDVQKDDSTLPTIRHRPMLLL